MKDLSPVLRSIKDKNPDAFVGFTYPPDTILASKQAKEVGFNPKFFYASVGTAFQLYKNVMTPAGAEGVLGMGSWNSKTSPGGQGLLRRPHQEVRRQGAGPLGQRRLLGRPGDPHRRGGEGRAGPQGDPRLRRRAPTHKTILGDIKFTGSENIATPGTVSQWQNGEFEVVWPPKVATAKLNAAKPAGSQRA